MHLQRCPGEVAAQAPCPAREAAPVQAAGQRQRAKPSGFPSRSSAALPNAAVLVHELSVPMGRALQTGAAGEGLMGKLGPSSNPAPC